MAAEANVVTKLSLKYHFQLLTW